MDVSQDDAAAPVGELYFAQISDSHIGFKKAANSDVVATLEVAIGRINALPLQPSFVVHRGDLTQHGW